jgi:hypothetical protein
MATPHTTHVHQSEWLYIHVCYASIDKRKKKKKIASQNNYAKGNDISGIMNRTGPLLVWN